MSELNPLLRRQLGRLGLSQETVPSSLESWQALLDRVSHSYDDADRERYLSERAFSISSREMQHLYERLKETSQHELTLERDKLAHALALQKAAFETMTEGVLVVDFERRVVTYNQAFLGIWRIPAEIAQSGDDEAVLASGLELVANKEQFLAKVNELYEHPEERSFDEVRFIDGRVLDRYSAPVHAPDGSVGARLWLFREVTEQRRAEDAERRARHFLNSVVENIPHTIFVKDAESLRYVLFNRAGEELFGVAHGALIGKTAHDLFPAPRAELFSARDREVLASGVMQIKEEPLQTTLGERVLHTKKIPIFDDSGKSRFLLGISHDITDERRNAEALRQSKEEAETANRAKTEFLANMSHELRTPLNSIVGFARVLDQRSFGTLTERQGDYLRYILVAGEHMLTLINDLLDLRRIEENRNALEISGHDVGTLLDAAVGMVKPLIDERRHVFELDAHDSMPRVLCDARAFVQVLVNLLSNAAKYTEAGGHIHLGIAADTCFARFAVADTGIGIAPEDQDKLFTYFTQVGAKHKAGMRGSGVGLALTRGLVERMGGSIDVTSAVGRGSRFVVSLPVEGAPSTL